ncbi:MAG: DUF885 domain-containing protein [Acidobacteriota bacterium]
MKSHRTKWFAVSCMAAVAFLAASGTIPTGAQESFDAFAERAAADWMRANPAFAAEQQYFSGAEQDALDRQLAGTVGAFRLPIDPVARDARVALAQRILAQLATFDRARLTAVQRTSVDLMASNLRQTVASAPLSDHTFIFEQIWGLHVTLVNFLTQIHPIRNPRDIENYLARLRLVGRELDLGIAETRKQEAMGVLLPRFLLQAVLGQLDRLLEPAPATNVLVTSLGERAARLQNVSAADRAASMAEAERIVREVVVPAFRRVRALLAAEVPNATDDAGLWRLPRGADAYASALQGHTTTNLTADEIHATGLREVARIEGEMDKLLRELGYVEGTVQARFDQLSEGVRPPADPDPRPKLLEEYTRIVRDAETRAETLFDLRPKAPVEVRREPAFTEKTAAAHYSAPARDGTRPGIVWIPLPEPRGNSQWTGAGARSVVYHEGVPGHHFQTALAQELSDVPRFRQYSVFGFSTAFSEGWGLYAERLAAEAGWYDGDPKGRLGQLNAELVRARRLVVDTGLHAKHWTRQQVIDYGIQPSEVDRYVALPGQACAYKIGELEILRLRAKAQQALGSRFSMKEFHNAVLRTGSVPLDVLGQAIEDWIAAVK